MQPTRWWRLVCGIGVGLLVVLGTAVGPATGEGEFAPWARSARIAGAAVFTGMTPAEIDTLLTSMINQKVSVIEADSDLSNYLDEAAFAQELSLMQDLATAAHARGVRVGWYYPALEVLTPNGKNIAKTMAKEHPDWIQLGLDGTPNVFYGAGVVFWVEKDMESAWMSPSSPGYRTYFLDRVRRIAATGVDYLWGDVPLLNDIGTDWADTNPASKAAFTAATGLTAPTALNWSDPTWRRWVAWRHQEIKDFLVDVAEAGMSVNPDFRFVVETVTMDYGSTKIALDGADLKDVPGVTQVWELDAISDSDAMRPAKEDDWIRMIAMNKHARGASGDKPSWIFTYGLQAEDAEVVMAESIAAGNSPYETKIPEMATSVGAAYRTRMFGWIQANADLLDDARSAARVALVYSPESHDYVDRAVGQALYATTTPTAAQFWTNDPLDSVYQRTYLAEYTGLVKVLVKNHIPFDVLVRPSAQELAGYQTVVLPDIEAIADEQADLLRTYVDAGGHLVATGPNPTGWDALGTARAEYALADVLGVTKSAALPATKTQTYGAGEARVIAALPGRKVLTGAADAAAAETSFLAAVNATTTPWLTTDADRRVHYELRRSPDGLTLVLHQVNAIGMDGTFSVVPTTTTTTLKVPDGYGVVAVELASPDNASPARTALSYTSSGTEVTFSAPVTGYSAVAITLAPTGSPAAPGAPAGVVGNAREGAIDLTWAAPASDGGSPIQGYKVRVYEGASGTPIGSPLDSPGTGRAFAVTGLTNGTSYRLDVSAYNAVGTGPASARSALVTPVFSPPGAVTGVAGVAGPAGAPGLGSVSLTWTAASTGAAPITSYDVQEALAAATPAWTSAGSVAGTTTKSDVTGLATGTSWVFRVRAVNAGGPGPWSAASAPVLVPVPVSVSAPGAPSGLVGTGGASSVELSWTAPTSDGGAPIQGYRVQVYEGASVTPSGLPLTSTGTGTTLTVSGLTNGTPYVFDVTAYNAVGAGPASAKSSPVTPAEQVTPPPPPGPSQSPGGLDSPSAPVLSPVPPVASAPSLAAVTCSAKALSGRTRIKVNVGPNLPGSQNYSFRLQKKVNRAWVPYSKVRLTKGRSETRTVNVPKGTWRAECYALASPTEAPQPAALSNSVKIRR